jgi:hypothetical protein
MHDKYFLFGKIQTLIATERHPEKHQSYNGAKLGIIPNLTNFPKKYLFRHICMYL